MGYVTPEHYSYGNPEAARKAIEPLAKYMNTTVEDVCEQILKKSYEKIRPVILELAEKYKLEKDQISLVGVGGGVSALLPYTAKLMELGYSIPENAEVISSIGVALAMIRDVVERVIPSPSKKDIADIKKEAANMAIANGAVPDTVEVQIEIDSQTSRVTAIALGSSEVQTTDLLKACTEEDAKEIAAKSMGVTVDETRLITKSNVFYVFTSKKKDGTNQIRIVDKKGFIKVQRGDGDARKCMVSETQKVIEEMWEQLAVFKNDIKLTPDMYLCTGGKVLDYAGMMDLDQLYLVVDTELATLEEDEEVILIGAKNDI